MVTALALMAFGGLASAASADDRVEWASSSTLVSNGAAVVGAASGPTLDTTLGTITCTDSTVSGTLTQNPGNWATGSITGVSHTGLADDVEGASTVSLSYTGCTDDIGCYTAPSTITGTATLARANSDNSTFTVSGLNVDVFLDSSCFFLPDRNCEYVGSASGDVTASNVTYDEEPIQSTSNDDFGCPAESLFSGVYELEADDGTTSGAIKLVEPGSAES